MIPKNSPGVFASDSSQFNRFEFKYWITERQKFGLLRYLEEFMDADPHNEANVGYKIQSLYFDSPDLHSYYQKYDGDFLRRKYRIRFYRDDKSTAFFEIKQKQNIFVQKRRASIDLSARDSDSLPAEIFNDPMPQIEFFVSGIAEKNLVPTCWVAYRRMAFFGRHNPKLRITFDEDLSGALADKLIFPGSRLHKVRYSNWNRPVILEIKFNSYMPTWLEKMIRDIGIMNAPISKYGEIIHRARFHYLAERSWTH
jgi:hypothetical protein